MKEIKKVFAIFVIYLMLSFSIDVSNAAVSDQQSTAPPTDAYPSDGNLEDREKWVVENLNKFNPDDPSQKEAFVRAYKNKKIELSNSEHEKAVSRYLSNYKNNIPEEDREMLKGFISHHTGIPAKSIDLKKGEGIKVEKVGNNIILIDSGNKRHDIKKYSLYTVSGQKLDKIISKDDGTIELVYGEVTIHLKDTTLIRDEQGNFILNDGSLLNLNSQSGRITIDGSQNVISCEGKNQCSFFIGKVNIDLDSGGTFQSLGDNKYSIVKGKATIEKNWCEGSCVFGLNKKQTKFSFVELRNYQNKFDKQDPKESLFSSALHLEDKKHGDANIRNGESNKDVFVCLDSECNLPSMSDPKYSGFVNYEEQERKFYARGILRIKVGENTYWDGSDENVVVSLSRPIYDGVNSPRSIFSLENCNGCEFTTEGKDVGTLIVNDQYSIFRYKDYADDLNKPRPALIRIEGRDIKRIASQLVELMDAPFTLAHKDLYGNIDTRNTRKYNSDSLLRPTPGGRSIQQYFQRNYQPFYLAQGKSYSEANILANKDYGRFLSEIHKRKESDYQYPTEVIILDKQAFNLDRDGNVNRFLNMYMIDRNGGNTATLLELINTGEFQRIVEKIDPVQLNRFNIVASILNAVIDKNRGFDLGESKSLAAFNSNIRGILGPVPTEEAQRLLVIYEERKLASLLLDNKILEDKRFEGPYQVYIESKDDRDIRRLLEPLLKEPSVLLEINKGIIENAQKDPKATHASILYYDENGNVATKTVPKENALAVATNDVITAYEGHQGNNEYYLNPEINTQIQGEYLLSQFKNEDDKLALQAFMVDLKERASAIRLAHNLRTKLPILLIDPNSPEVRKKYTELEIWLINRLPDHPRVSELIKNKELDTFAEDLFRLKELYTSQRQNEALKTLKSGATYILPQNWGEAVLLGFDVGTLVASGGTTLALKGVQVAGKLSKFVPRPEYLKYVRGSPNLRKVLRGKYDNLRSEPQLLARCGTAALVGAATVTGAVSRGAGSCDVSNNVRTVVGREPGHLNPAINTERAARETLTGRLAEDVVEHKMKISPDTLKKEGEKYWLGIGNQLARELKRDGEELFSKGLVYKESFPLPDGGTAHVFTEFSGKASEISERATGGITNYILQTHKRAKTLPELQSVAKRMLKQFREDTAYLRELGFDDTLPVQKAIVRLDGNGVTTGILYEIKPGAYQGKWLNRRPDLLERFSNLPIEQQNRIEKILDRLTGRITD